MKTPTTWIWFVLIVVPLAASIELNPGQTTTFTYTNSSNETTGEPFVCRAANTTQVCGVSNTTINLSPGEMNRVFNVPHGQVTASCNENNSQSSDLCVINIDLEPGENYHNTGGACNVRIDVDEAAEDQCDVTTYTKHENVKITKDRHTQYIEFQGQRIPFPANASEYSYEFGVDLTCPTSITLDERQDPEDVQFYCKHLLPLTVSALDDTLTTCTNATQNFDLRRDEWDNERTRLQEQINSCDRALSDERAAKEQAVKNSNEAGDALVLCENKASNRLAYSIVGWVLAFVFGVAALLLKFTRGDE